MDHKCYLLSWCIPQYHGGCMCLCNPRFACPQGRFCARRTSMDIRLIISDTCIKVSLCNPQWIMCNNHAWLTCNNHPWLWCWMHRLKAFLVAPLQKKFFAHVIKHEPYFNKQNPLEIHQTPASCYEFVRAKKASIHAHVVWPKQAGPSTHFWFSNQGDTISVVGDAVIPLGYGTCVLNTENGSNRSLINRICNGLCLIQVQNAVAIWDLQHTTQIQT